MSFRELGINDSDGLARHYGKTFLWMAIALALTAAVAWYMYDSWLWVDLALAFGGYGSFILLIAQLVLVVVISSMLQKLSFPVMLALFFAYSALTGINLSVIFVAYTFSSIALAFVCSALLFVNMGIIGYVTKRDLSRFGNILLAGLITLAVTTFINIFLGLEGLEMIMNYVGVLLFMGLTAYDMQKVKAHYYAVSDGSEEGAVLADKLSIYCALELYLDFINMFLRILRILGRSNSRR